MRMEICLQIPHNTLNRLKNYFSQLLNVHGVNDVRLTEMQTVETLIPKPSSFKVETATEELKIYKSPSTDKILTELVQAGGNILHSEIHKLINSIWNKEELLQQWKESITVFINRVTELTVIVTEDIIVTNYVQNFIKYPSLKVNNKQMKVLGIISVDSDATNQLKITCSGFNSYWSIKGEYISYF
jgi:hypothetical protein